MEWEILYGNTGNELYKLLASILILDMFRIYVNVVLVNVIV